MMKHRNGALIEQPGDQDRLLGALYGCLPGRALLRLLICPTISKAAGAFLSSRFSRGLIQPFIRKNNIDMTQFDPSDPAAYSNYNEFFSRKIRSGMRPIDPVPKHLIAPCDSKLTALPIGEDSRFTLKQTPYTLESLLRNPQTAEKFIGGYALIFRLTVDDYHRYCYIADGTISESTRIDGVLHTVNPIANDHYPIYKENSREYSILHTENFGDVLMMEVGALLVGKIVNHRENGPVVRGQEKGYLQFGGSTVVLLLHKDAVQIDADILENSRMNIETIVRMGEKIGVSAR